jgi:hypothetical protein
VVERIIQAPPTIIEKTIEVPVEVEVIREVIKEVIKEVEVIVYKDPVVLNEESNHDTLKVETEGVVVEPTYDVGISADSLEEDRVHEDKPDDMVLTKSESDEDVDGILIDTKISFED